MTLINKNYPVFEADQVLSQKQLNGLVSYLEEQDRASRIHLLGIGIVCGLEILKPNPTTINITCGTGITSLGFLITLETGNYTHYKKTTLSEHFLSPDFGNESYLADLYKYSHPEISDEEETTEEGFYHSLGEIEELIKNSDVAEENNGVEEIVEITEGILREKIVVLLLEVKLINEKNCVTNDCRERGKHLEFKLRPLLISKSFLKKYPSSLNECLNYHFDTLTLPRYNTPRTPLVSGLDVLSNFDELINKSKNNISEAIEKVHDRYSEAYNSLERYDRLKNVLNWIESTNNEYSNDFQRQYLWDWLSDLAATYNEIVNFHTCYPELCCPDKRKFPFHLLLGSAEFKTDAIPPEDDLQHYRTSFIKAGILAHSENQQKLSLELLLEKLIHQIDFFDLQKDEVKKMGIKITPSLLGKQPLSKRAIPFYYSEMNQLNKFWSPELRLKNKNQNILSYHSEKYNSANEAINSPLLYDIEPYNFFRIEGHVGQKHVDALIKIEAIKDSYSLPFKVIALNATDYKNKRLNLNTFQGDFGEMELDYDLVRRDWENVIGKSIEWLEANFQDVQDYFSNQDLNTFIRDLKTGRNSMKESLIEYLKIHHAFIEIYEDIEEEALKKRKDIFSNLPSEKNPEFAEDLIDHLDTIILVCQKGEFRAIFQAAQEKWKTIGEDLTLKKFIEKHPGIEHKAGVPKGGTFIMIYQDDNAYNSNQNTKNSSVSDVSNSSKGSVFLENNQKKKENRNLETLYAAPVRYAEDFQKMISKYAKANLSKENRIALENFIESNKGAIGVNESNKRNYTIPNQIIIADFFLPYICCSNGNNINIVLESTEPLPIVADFDGDDFNKDDFFTNKQ